MIMLLAFKVGWSSSQSQTFRTYLSPNVHDSDDSGTSSAAAAHECASSCRSSGWEESTDAALFALLRDKLKSGNTEQVFELKDTQRLKKHLQQVFVFFMPNLVVARCGCLHRILKFSCNACSQVFDQLCANPMALQ